MRNRSAVGVGRVEALGQGEQLNAPFVKVGDHSGRVGDGAEESIQLGHDHDGPALLCGSEELAPGGTAGERLAAADARIFEALRQAESFHLSMGGDALTLGLKTEAAIGLFFGGDSDVGGGVFRGVGNYFTACR